MGKRASCLALLGRRDAGEPTKLALAGGKSDDTLGRLWIVDPETLEWETLGLGERERVEPEPEPEGEPAAPERPSFVATRLPIDRN